MNIKSINIVIVLVLFPFLLSAQSINWEMAWGGNDLQEFRDIIKIRSSYYCLVYSSITDGFGVMKLDTNGSEIWTTSLDTVIVDSSSYHFTSSTMRDIREGYNNSILVNVDYSGSLERGGVLQLDSNGNIEWFKMFGFTTTNLGKYPNGMHVLPNGDILVAGVHESASFDHNVFAVRMDRYGNVKWKRQYFKGSYQHVFDMISYSDGSFYIAGATGIVSINKDSLYLIKMEPQNGNIIFEKGNKVPDDTTIHPYHWLRDIEEDKNHNLVSSAWTMNGAFTAANGHIMRFDSAFSLLFTKYEPKGVPVYGYQSEDNNYVHSFAAEISNYNNSIIQKSNTLGDSIWAFSLDGRADEYAWDGNGGLMGCGYKDYPPNISKEFYLAHLKNMGKPAKVPCRNKPVIDTMYASLGPGFFQFEDSVRGGLEYNPELYHQWYFQDGQRADTADPLINFDNVAYPDSFWAVLIVFDGAGCSDTMSINAYTNEEIDFPLDDPVISGVNEEQEGSIGIAAYPNPFTHDITFDIRTSQTEKGTIQIVSVTGQQVYIQAFTSNSPFTLQEDFTKGLYFVQIRVGEQSRVVKVVKQ